MRRPAASGLPQSTDIVRPPRHVGCQLRTCRRTRPGQLCTAFVAKVENRTAPKIPRKLIFRQLYRWKALERRYEGPMVVFPRNNVGPSRRHVRDATAALKIFVRNPKKNFATHKR